MSPATPATPEREPGPDATGRWSARRFARQWARAIVIGWLIAVVILLGRLVGGEGLQIAGDPDGLLPAEHRAPTGEPLLLLTLDDDGLDADAGGTDALLSAATSIAETLGDRRVPLGPPAAELTAWLDAHLLYLLPVSAHEALAARLQSNATAEAVDALRARLSSPMFGVSGEQPRRDPLRLAALAEQHAGRLTHLGNVEDMPAELTPAGDLLALDGRSLLIALRTEEQPDALTTELDAVIEGQPVHVHVIGPSTRQAEAKAAIERHGPRLALLALAGIVLVLSLALRAVRPVAAIVLALTCAVIGVLAMGSPLGLHTVPLVVLLVGFGCEGAMHLSRISPRGWPSAAVLGSALLPLLLSPYPTWQRAAIEWFFGVAAVVLLLRLVVPALLELMRFAPAPARRGFPLRPLRPLAALLTIGALGAGGLALSRLPFIAIDRTPRPATDDDASRRVREGFFDPQLVARAQSVGDTPTAALEASAEHARQLASLVPKDAARVDSPGRLVLPLAQLEARRRSLSQMELDEHMDALREQLSTRGFRPDAFGEFLRGATNLDDMPTPTAALEGPLGPWIAGYVRDTNDGTSTLVTLVHLHADDNQPVPALASGEGPPLHLMGPAVAARRDRAGFADSLGLYLAVQLWLGALVVWLATRRLTVALGCSVAAFSAQAALLAAMVPLGIGFGPALLPAILLVGAAATIAGARACRAVVLGERFYAMGLLLSALCQVVAGLTLVASADPLWSQIGVVIAVGAMIASGTGLFVAPGMMRLFGGPAKKKEPT